MTVDAGLIRIAATAPATVPTTSPLEGAVVPGAIGLVALRYGNPELH